MFQRAGAYGIPGWKIGIFLSLFIKPHVFIVWLVGLKMSLDERSVLKYFVPLDRVEEYTLPAATRVAVIHRAFDVKNLFVQDCIDPKPWKMRQRTSDQQREFGHVISVLDRRQSSLCRWVLHLAGAALL